MMLFHGSYVSVIKPDISFSRNNVDFGRGFYTTPLWEQAVSWANRFKRKHGQSVVSSYEIDMDNLPVEVKVLTFDTHSEDWLDFIHNCRRKKNTGDYDIVIGGVANDRVFNALGLYESGWLNKADAINRLKYKQPNIQYCFRNQRIIDTYLKFTGNEVIK
jgi:hypothetical protein